MTEVLALVLGFVVVTLASQHIGKLSTYAKMPLITGYLLAGALVGPFALGWISADSARSLRFVDHVSLGFIAFAAGSELYLKEMRSQLKTIAWLTLGQLLATFTLAVVTMLLIADLIPFMAQMPFATRFAVALLAAAILIARSPSSAIAIIGELRARGPYTKTALGVTMVMDAVVILLFATCVAVSHSLVGADGFDPQTIIVVVVDLLFSVSVGFVVGRLIRSLCLAGLALWIKTAIILALGLGVFLLADVIHEVGRTYLSFSLSLEPLLVCMIAGFVVTNHSGAREEFAAALHQVAPYVYLVFFTFVGASLSLDALWALWPIALALFGIRLLGLILGSVGGALLAKASAQHRRLGWMAFVTQAGVGLGLAKNVAHDFPSFGTEFAAMIIAVIVLNQLVGPPLLKFAIRRVGESHLRGTARPDEVRDAVILGIDDQSLAVARQLGSQNWKVVMADTDESHVKRLSAQDVDERHIEEVNEKSLNGIAHSGTDALVAMLDDDEANLHACELAYEKLGITRIVVRLHDLSMSDKFEEMGVRIVEPNTAMVNLLDQFVRLPHLATLLLHRDPEHDVIQVTIDDPDIEGLPIRDLRLPPTVRVLGINRAGHAIVPYGYSVLHHNDEVTMVGDLVDLKKVASRWGY